MSEVGHEGLNATACGGWVLVGWVGGRPSTVWPDMVLCLLLLAALKRAKTILHSTAECLISCLHRLLLSPLFLLSPTPCSKTTVIINSMFMQWLKSHLDPSAPPYRGVFVTTSPTLKGQAANAFTRYQVGVVCVWCGVCGRGGG